MCVQIHCIDASTMIPAVRKFLDFGMVIHNIVHFITMQNEGGSCVFIIGYGWKWLWLEMGLANMALT
jgi:hypothetical protein